MNSSQKRHGHLQDPTIRRWKLVALASTLLLPTCVLTAITALPAGASTTFYVNNGSVTGSSDTSCSTALYSTIQNAVNGASSGDTVDVCRGSYPGTVAVDKNISLLGAQAGVEGASHSGAESVVIGFSVTNANVTLNGFDIVPGSSNSGAGIVINGGSSETVEDNVITGYETEGMAFLGTSGLLFQHNLVANPVLTSPAPPNGPAQDGVYAGTGVSNNAQILDNVFESASSYPGTDIGLSYTSGIDAVISGNVSTDGATLVTLFNSTGSEITDNSFTGDPSLSASAIYIGGGDSNTTVSDNSESGGYFGVALRNIYGDGPNVGTTITGNSLTANYGGGISVTGTAIGSSETVVAEQNNLGGDNPVGVGNSTTGSVDAVDNYWGSTDPNFTTLATGTVTFSPWYVDAALTTLSNENIYVGSSYMSGSAGGHVFGYNAFSTIQAGVNAASDGGTVTVTAGTYSGAVTVSQSITLLGAQAGVDARVRSGSESLASSISIGASNVTVDGFSFNGTSTQVSVSSATTLSGVVVEDDIFSGYGPEALPTYDAGNILIEDNRFASPSGSGEAIQVKASVVQGGCNGTQVLDNLFSAATTNGAADVTLTCTDSNSSNVVVSGNTSTANSGGSSFVAISGVIGGISVADNTATTTGSSLFFFGSVAGTASVSNNTFTGGSSNAVSIHGADALGTDDVANTGTFSFSGNTFTGDPRGIYVSASALGAGAQVNVHGDDIAGNATAEIENDSSVVVDASGTWWGSAGGPAAIAGVTTTPWCISSSCSTLSNNANLTSLSLSAGTLSPAFSPATIAYTADVGNGVTSVTVTATANLGATTLVIGGSNLAVGDNTLTIKVTSSDGTTKTYTVIVDEAAPTSPPTTTPPTTTTTPPTTTTTTLPTTTTPPPTTLPPAPLPALPTSIPSASFGKPTTATVTSTAPTTIAQQSGMATATVAVPAGALPAGTTVSVAPVVNASALQAAVPQGTAYVTSFAVSWVAPDGTSPAATSPITMTVSDPAIKAGDTIYEVTTKGLVAVGTATAAGTVTITFSDDPAFIIAAAPKLTFVKPIGTVEPKGIALKLDCRPGAPCRGTAELTLARRATAGDKSVLTRPTLASATLSLAAGSTRTVLFRLTAAGKSTFAESAPSTQLRLNLSSHITGVAPRTSLSGAISVTVRATGEARVGYYVADAEGAVSGFGGVETYGSLSAQQLAAAGPTVGMVTTADGKGYYLVSRRGVVSTFGDAVNYGSIAGLRLTAAPGSVVGMSLSADGKGYWLVSSTGGVYSFGDAQFYGAASARVTASGGVVVGMARTPDGKGYWLTSNLGSVYAFGDARVYGDLLGVANIVASIAATPDGNGYWLATGYGAVYPFGDARNYGNAISIRLPGLIVDIAPTSDGKGYYLLGDNGMVYRYGDANESAGLPPSRPQAIAVAVP